MLLSHADRSRFFGADGGASSGPVGPAKGAVLVDGCVRAIWRVDVDKANGRATASVEHHPMPKRALAAMAAEGASVLAAGRD